MTRVNIYSKCGRAKKKPKTWSKGSPSENEADDDVDHYDHDYDDHYHHDGHYYHDYDDHYYHDGHYYVLQE